MAATFKTIQEFLFPEGARKTFVIPNYQRGYKWAVREKGEPSAVQQLVDDLLKANREQEYFLQGVTVCEEGDKIILIDGQQRTTTLYLLLWCLDGERVKDIDLEYDIREKSKAFIKGFKNREFDYENYDPDNSTQDIYYFKEAIKQIKSKVDETPDRESFLEFLLNKVTILYIIIDKEKATKTFTMMNGSKATMLQEELVKAEMLRKISLPDTEKKEVSSSLDENLFELREIISKDWQTNALRSRYAREWDKWLYWWNRKDVEKFFKVETPLGLLLEYYYRRKEDGKDFDFANFRELITDKQHTKTHFKRLRDLQKSFEDMFNSNERYNYLGVSMIDAESKFEVVGYFIQHKNNIEALKQYAKKRVVGSTHLEITNDEKTEISNKAQAALDMLSQKHVYQDQEGKPTPAKKMAYKVLLWYNVKEIGDNHKFNFDVFQTKSLEHICPQNPDGKNVDFIVVKTKIEQETKGVHSIGNLVLLNGSVNSGLSNGDLAQKRKYLFDKIKDGFLLPHTLRVFSRGFSPDSDESLFDESKYWTAKDVKDNEAYFIAEFEKEYSAELPKGNK